MRTSSIATCVFALLAAINSASGAGGPQPFSGDVYSGDDYCDACDPCANCRRHHHHNGLFGHNRDLGFNCGCNGSYKFPVPPLYTYHWPGMYQQVLMTDYHSPWRFPPLKPYVDETPPEVLGSAISMRRVRQASATAPARSSPSATFSARLEESLR